LYDLEAWPEPLLNIPKCLLTSEKHHVIHKY
jgi:hypothetical protein